MITVLFACVHNAGRSQIAAALFNAKADPTKARGLSAGTEPTQRVHPEVVLAMSELGIDLSRVNPRLLTNALAASVQVLVTMGCGAACPVVPGVRREDWPVPDPKGKLPDDVRKIRDDIDTRVSRLVRAHGWEA